MTNIKQIFSRLQIRDCKNKNKLTILNLLARMIQLIEPDSLLMNRRQHFYNIIKLPPTIFYLLLHLINRRTLINIRTTLQQITLIDSNSDGLTASTLLPNSIRTLSLQTGKECYNNYHFIQLNSKMVKVMRVYCTNCNQLLTSRAMPIYLVSSPNIKGFSSDIPSQHTQEQGDPKKFDKCGCKIKDLVCANCKQNCGHHVVEGCHPCLSAPNNGHYWIIMKGIGEATQFTWGDAAALPF